MLNENTIPAGVHCKVLENQSLSTENWFSVEWESILKFILPGGGENFPQLGTPAKDNFPIS